MRDFIEIRPIDARQVALLERLAREDNHGVLAPTHVITKSGEIVGYFSVMGVPHVACWLSTKAMNARDSFTALNAVENQVALAGGGQFVLSVPPGSPMRGFFEEMGYVNGGNYDLMLRKVN